MNHLIETLRAQIDANAEVLATEEQKFRDAVIAIKRGLDPVETPSAITARIKYHRGVHMGYANSLHLVQALGVNA